MANRKNNDPSSIRKTSPPPHPKENPMSKLNQIIAVANGKKSRASSEVTRVHHLMQKPDLYSGINRTYTPKDDDGERRPPESKNVQYTVRAGITEVRAVLGELFDAVAAQDNTNCHAAADLTVGDRVLIAKCPVTTLLFLEKQLVDIHTFVDKLPTLDPSDTWTFDSVTDSYRSESHDTLATRKVPKAFVAYEATKEHPAQVQVYNEDVVVGSWRTTKFSGAIPAKDKNAMLARVRQLQEAVKLAREKANMEEVVDLKIADPVLGFVFGNDAS